MSFRRRNVGISSSSSSSSPSPSLSPPPSLSSSLPPPPSTSSPSQKPTPTSPNPNTKTPTPQPQPQHQHQHLPPGIRPSPLDGRPITSTGTATLDGLLAGHGGLPLGASVVLEEGGTTDYAGAVLRFYAAEGAVQGQSMWVVGVGEEWGRGLPGLAQGDGARGKGRGAREGMVDKLDRGELERERTEERMKIAWRYETLRSVGREATATERHQGVSDAIQNQKHLPFCHTFDLTKRLDPSHRNQISYLPLAAAGADSSPFTSITGQLSERISNSPLETVHRIVIPSLLSPAIYPPHASHPYHVLQFLHSIRALLSLHPRRLTAMITLPLFLFPRSTGLVRWIELLCDGVIELTPFPHSSDVELSGDKTPSAGAAEEQPQGMLKIHRLPVFHERGGGSHAVGEDWVFTLSRKKFGIKPFNLPPIEGNLSAQQGKPEGKIPSKSELEF